MIGMTCTSTQTAGGSTDVGNGVVCGIVVDSVGTPVKNARVMLFHFNHDPAMAPDSFAGAFEVARTDSVGAYTLGNVDSGRYNIEIRYDGRCGSFVHDIFVRNREISTLPRDTVTKYGRMKIELPEHGVITSGYLFMPGSSIYKILDSLAIARRELRIDSVPPGILPVLYYRSSLTGAYVVQAASEIEIEHNGEIEIEFEGTDTLGYYDNFDD
jgi:hypothetical protein